jgi:glycosyltransferase involved in cell wall biosynthesis
LFFKYTVLDVFDSIFLRKNQGGEKLKLLKQLLYLPANKIIVTDENRYNLMPDRLRTKSVILPNYPGSFSFDKKKEGSGCLRILYNGWMGQKRGTEIIEGLIKTKLPLKIFMAGWFSDDYTRELVKKYPESIEFLGVLPQQEALKLAQQKADYILCVYAPVNQNNINASPNKVYDAIQTCTPLIINAEIKVSEWVREMGIGFIMNEYDIKDYPRLYAELNEMKGSFVFSEKIKTYYTWENIEGNLLKAHQLK